MEASIIHVTSAGRNSPSLARSLSLSATFAERGVSGAPLHLDAGRGPSAGRQHGAGGQGAHPGESAGRAQRFHVPLHGPESSGLHGHAHPPHSVWYVRHSQP